jgi:hypothetical protein
MTLRNTFSHWFDNAFAYVPTYVVSMPSNFGNQAVWNLTDKKKGELWKTPALVGVFLCADSGYPRTTKRSQNTGLGVIRDTCIK